MTGNTREFKGEVVGVTRSSGHGHVPLNDHIDLGDDGDVWVRMSPDPGVMRALIGRRVRVTVEVLDG